MFLIIQNKWIKILWQYFQVCKLDVMLVFFKDVFDTLYGVQGKVFTSYD